MFLPPSSANMRLWKDPHTSPSQQAAVIVVPEIANMTWISPHNLMYRLWLWPARNITGYINQMALLHFPHSTYRSSRMENTLLIQAQTAQSSRCWRICCMISPRVPGTKCKCRGTWVSVYRIIPPYSNKRSISHDQTHIRCSPTPNVPARGRDCPSVSGRTNGATST